MAEGDSAMEMRIAGHEEKVDAFAIRDDYNEMLTCESLSAQLLPITEDCFFLFLININVLEVLTDIK